MRLLPLLLLALLLPLTSCYEPLYGQKSLGSAAPSATEAKLNNVGIDNIPDESGQQLKNLLIDRLYAHGRPAAPAYELKIALFAVEEKLGLQIDATTTRARVRLTANYELFDRQSRLKLFGGSSHSINDYNILDQQYGTLNEKEDAYRRGLTELADIITARLALELGNIAQTPIGANTGTAAAAPLGQLPHGDGVPDFHPAGSASDGTGTGVGTNISPP